MPIRYTPKSLESVFEDEGTRIVFRTPNEKELLAYGSAITSKLSKVIEHGKFVQERMERSHWEHLFLSDIEFLASLVVSIDGLEDQDGNTVDTTVWDIAAKTRFLSWLDTENKVFADFKSKLVQPQKKTS